MNNILISFMLSNLGYLSLSGNIDSIKYLYRNIWTERPPLIRTVSELQGRLTSTENIKTFFFKKDFLGLHKEYF